MSLSEDSLNISASIFRTLQDDVLDVDFIEKEILSLMSRMPSLSPISSSTFCLKCENLFSNWPETRDPSNRILRILQKSHGCL